MFDEELGFMKLQAGDVCQFLFLPVGTKFQPIVLDGEGVTYTKTDDYGNCITVLPLRRFHCEHWVSCRIIDLPIEYELMTYMQTELFAVKQQRFAEKFVEKRKP